MMTWMVVLALGCVTSKKSVSVDRLSKAQLEGLGDVGDSVCRGYQAANGMTIGDCTVRGPYMGEIRGGLLGDAHESYEAALQACEASPGCIGVSTDWYIGATWSPVLGEGSFQVDEQSYGCTLVLDCSNP